MIAPWITVDSLEDPASPFAQEAVESASYVLWLLSGRKYSGVATTTETYCQMGLNEAMLIWPNMLHAAQGMHIWPELRDGLITNRVGGCCSDCGCPHMVRLRGGPVLSVQSVYHGEREVPLTEVAIFDYSYITSPNKCWNTCDEVEVTYTFGASPPAMGKMAARELANQFVMAMTDDAECQLPQRITQVSRQGVSWTLLDPQDFLDKGLTGIYAVDLFLRVTNPDKKQLRARVFSPDLPRAKTHRWAAVPTLMGQLMLRAASGAQFGPAPASAPAAPVPAPMAMTMLAGTQTEMTVATPAGVNVYEGRPLRWVVPGSFGADSPPVVTVQPSGREVPPDTLLWRNGNYTLDLTADQVEQLLPPGSVLVVSPQVGSANTTGQASYHVERRTL